VTRTVVMGPFTQNRRKGYYGGARRKGVCGHVYRDLGGGREIMRKFEGKRTRLGKLSKTITGNDADIKAEGERIQRERFRHRTRGETPAVIPIQGSGEGGRAITEQLGDSTEKQTEKSFLTVAKKGDYPFSYLCWKRQIAVRR